MPLWRFLLATAIAWGLAGWLGWAALQGLRTGRVRYSGQRICRRSRQPGLYAFLIVLFSAWAALILWAWWHTWLR